jgi:hypothetical protein
MHSFSPQTLLQELFPTTVLPLIRNPWEGAPLSMSTYRSDSILTWARNGDWAVIFTSREKAPVPTEQDAKWAPEPGWKILDNRKPTPEPGFEYNYST